MTIKKKAQSFLSTHVFSIDQIVIMLSHNVPPKEHDPPMKIKAVVYIMVTLQYQICVMSWDFVNRFCDMCDMIEDECHYILVC